jgi:hypothetical protein
LVQCLLLFTCLEAAALGAGFDKHKCRKIIDLVSESGKAAGEAGREAESQAADRLLAKIESKLSTEADDSSSIL